MYVWFRWIVTFVGIVTSVSLLGSNQINTCFMIDTDIRCNHAVIYRDYAGLYKISQVEHN